MHKKCSRCELVNWPNDVQCRRCGNQLGVASESSMPILRPKVEVDNIQFSEDDDAAYDEAKGLIKKGVNAGMIYGGISLLIVLVLQAFVPIAGNFLKYAYLDIAIIYCLTFGIHLKSRACAGLMLVYYVLSKLALLQQGSLGIIGILVAVMFIKTFYQAWQGTKLYHQIKQARPRHIVH